MVDVGTDNHDTDWSTSHALTLKSGCNVVACPLQFGIELQTEEANQ